MHARSHCNSNARKKARAWLADDVTTAILIPLRGANLSNCVVCVLVDFSYFATMDASSSSSPSPKLSIHLCVSFGRFWFNFHGLILFYRVWQFRSRLWRFGEPRCLVSLLSTIFTVSFGKFSRSSVNFILHPFGY